MRQLALTLSTIACLSVGVALSAVAADPDPNAIPAVGSVAPAFALHALGMGDSDERSVVELDEHCGLRPGNTKAVVVAFLNATHEADLDLLNSWYRKFHRKGLDVVAVSVERTPTEFDETIRRARLRYPVVDDRHLIVSHRYGVPDAPFVFLLNSECRVIGFSNKPPVEDEASLAAVIEAQIAGQISSDRRFDD